MSLGSGEEGIRRNAQPPSFETFFEQEHPRLFRALCLVTGNRHEAEELMQDAFLRVLERWDRVRLMDDPVGYLYRVAMNAFRTQRRRLAIAAKKALRIVPPDDGIAEIEMRDAVVRALTELSRRQRAAVVLIDLLGYPSREAARMLGIRASTLRMHASRARAHLREWAEGER